MQRQLNKTKFLTPIDADTTQANIYYIKKRFMRYPLLCGFVQLHLLTVRRFCHEKEHGSWKKAIRRRYCDKGLIMTFLYWICETYL